LDRRESKLQRKLGLFGKENSLKTAQEKDLGKSPETWMMEASGGGTKSVDSIEETDEVRLFRTM